MDHRQSSLKALLDGLTYHYYTPDSDFGVGLERGRSLLEYNKPVYINEYGSTAYWSDGQEGALWHSYVLPLLWREGISPVQFSLSEFPGMHEGYNRLGLMRGWEHNWDAKPAYSVYAGFFRHMGPTVPVSSTVQTPLIVAAGLGSGARPGGLAGDSYAAVWVVNIAEDDQLGVAFRVRGFPSAVAQVTVYDVLAGDVPVDAFQVRGAPLAFAYNLPARSVHVFELATRHGSSGVGE